MKLYLTVYLKAKRKCNESNKKVRRKWCRKTIKLRSCLINASGKKNNEIAQDEGARLPRPEFLSKADSSSDMNFSLGGLFYPASSVCENSSAYGKNDPEPSGELPIKYPFTEGDPASSITEPSAGPPLFGRSKGPRLGRGRLRSSDDSLQCRNTHR